ncbi:MAG: NifU N-terminal domain-containing protein [Chthoniobacterales bacterium]|nr:NifU N-terminal domain-containing protein [Chthoniobacterales bacterium]
MAFRVVDVEITPNPNALKFILDHPCSENTISFLNPKEGTGHPLAEKLFAIRGVASLLLLGDFITVNKEPGAAWSEIRPAVEATLAAYD